MSAGITRKVSVGLTAFEIDFISSTNSLSKASRPAVSTRTTLYFEISFLWCVLDCVGVLCWQGLIVIAADDRAHIFYQAAIMLVRGCCEHAIGAFV